VGARVVWDQGGAGEVLAISNDAVRVRSTIPSPPGSRLGGALESDPQAKLRIKVHSSKKQDDGSFLLEGRPLDLGRELRERIEQAITGSTSRRTS
jgi:hypothetical protein